MPVRKRKKASTDLCLRIEKECVKTIVFGHPKSDSWFRVDVEDECVVFDSSNMHGKARLNADKLERLIDWLDERWNEIW